MPDVQSLGEGLHALGGLIGLEGFGGGLEFFLSLGERFTELAESGESEFTEVGRVEADIGGGDDLWAGLLEDGADEGLAINADFDDDATVGVEGL